MIKKATVFSLVREQSVFMTAIMALLTFLVVLSLGLALAIGTGARRWNAQWDLYATVQVTDRDNVTATGRVIENNRNRMNSVREISTQEMHDLLRPWMSGGGDMSEYLPKMYEIKFKSADDMTAAGAEIAKSARFLPHAQALKTSTSAGWKMIMISVLVLVLVLGTIGVCISHIARNTAMLHRRELEILNQIGATDSFVARQMQIIVARICVTATAVGFVAALPVLLLILSAARSARVGLMAMMGLGGVSWTLLCLMPVLITIFAIWITRRTTLNILKNN